MNDLKKIQHLKTKCSFSYSMKNEFCESISFYDKNNIFENTIRRNPLKKNIVDIISDFPFLKNINLRKSRLNYFPKFVSKEIEFLDLSCNNIEKIEDYQLNLPNLKYLNLGSNKIKEVPNLSHLIFLESLKLHKNPIITFPNVNKNIKILNLFLTDLKEVPKEIFNFFDLEIFSFGLSKIKNFPCFSHLKKIRWLILPLNEFETIPHDICNCINLEGLILSKNNIKKIPKQIENLCKLKILSLYGNKIKKLPDSFYNLNLEKLSLSRNPLKNKKYIKNKLKKINFLKI